MRGVDAASVATVYSGHKLGERMHSDRVIPRPESGRNIEPSISQLLPVIAVAARS